MSENFISEEQYAQISKQLKDVIQYSQGFSDLNLTVDGIMEDWLRNKQKFIQFFGGSPIWESKEVVEFPLTEKELLNKVDQFTDTVYESYGNSYLYHFISAQRESLLKNVMDEEYKIPEYSPYSPNKVIPKGMKVIKAFKYFVDEPKELREIQDMASQIVQEGCVKGKLCFSVHPLDFLSISENQHGWRSCHSLDGEYRAGNLSYIVDNSTMVCYLKSEKGDIFYLPNFPPKGWKGDESEDIPWNSKKWRVLMFVSETNDFAIASRQYPYAIESSLEVVLDHLKKIASSQNSSGPMYQLVRNEPTWENRFIDSFNIENEEGVQEKIVPMSSLIMTNNKVYNYSEVITSAPGDLAFSDWRYARNSSSLKYLAHNAKWGNFNTQPPKITVGGKVLCPCCGVSYLKENESMVCLDCEVAFGSRDDDDFGYCACCGAHMCYELGETVIDHSGDCVAVCEDCLSRYYEPCSCCGEWYEAEDLTIVEDRNGEEVSRLCPQCYDDYCEEQKER